MPFPLFFLCLATFVYYFLVIMSICMGEYKKKQSMLIDLFIPFGAIFRSIIEGYKKAE